MACASAYFLDLPFFFALQAAGLGGVEGDDDVGGRWASFSPQLAAETPPMMSSHRPATCPVAPFPHQLNPLCRASHLDRTPALPAEEMRAGCARPCGCVCK